MFQAESRAITVVQAIFSPLKDTDGELAHALRF
jgi:hypothetical protein